MSSLIYRERESKTTNMAAEVSPASGRWTVVTAQSLSGSHFKDVKDVYIEHHITSEYKGASGAYKPSVMSQKLMKTQQRESLFTIK